MKQKLNTVITSAESYRDANKSVNLLKYEIVKKQKALKKLQKLVAIEKDSVEKIKLTQGHYSVRNVNKRDAIASKNRKQLREANQQIRNLQQVIVAIQSTANENQLKINREHGVTMRTELKKKELNIDNLVAENEMLKEKVADVNAKKVKSIKSTRYLKQTVKNLRNGSQTNKDLTILKKELALRDKEIGQLQNNIEILKEELADKHNTKNSDGSFNNNMRLCVIELAGLEVAVEKIPSVIETVSKHLFLRQLSKTDLPGKTSVQAMIDEGHFLAKTFVAEKLNDTKAFGLQRDGTSRKKQKLLDTSVTLDSGEIISLGFTRVAKETAKSIDTTTKHHITELAALHENYVANGNKETPVKNLPVDKEEPRTPRTNISDNFIAESLQKLAFSMSDRASNEKLADKLLDEWRNEVLEHCDNDQILPVHHFHCMAHVLLGFHKYACDNLKVYEKILTAEKGPLGRDCLPQFKTWRKTGTVVERTTRTTSETFGPAGDHLGVRDRWEAYCAQKGIKSMIGNYKDNRFNAIFQTSAEVYLHAKDFIEVLETVDTPNLKLQAVKADLSSGQINVFLQCFGLLYVNVTGPYWNLVSSGNVPYLLLYTYIQDLAKYLKECSEDPAVLLHMQNPWNDDAYNIPNHQRFAESLCVLNTENKELLFEIVKVATMGMLKCVQKQLVDFLPGGKYSEKPEVQELTRTQYAHVTNLGCEHHFGDLDHSQRRRPNASMHHHSSIQIIKRNRKSLMKWIEDMPSANKDSIMKSARKGGQNLRKTHLEMEKEVLSEIHEEMTKKKSTPKKRKKRQDHDNQEYEDPFEVDISRELPKIEQFIDNEYIVVAYQDMWYPGCVIKSNGKEATVNFMAPTRKPGVYVWPLRKDIQTVKSEFVLKRGYIPECLNSGRQWSVPNYKNIDLLFEKFSDIYFKS